MGRYGLAAAMVNNEIWIAGGRAEGNQGGSRSRNCNHHGNDNAYGSVANTRKNNNNNNNGVTGSVNSSPPHVITDTMEIYTQHCCHELSGGHHSKETGFQNIFTAVNADGQNGVYEADNSDDDIHGGAMAAVTITTTTTTDEMCNCTVGQWIKSKLHLRTPR